MKTTARGISLLTSLVAAAAFCGGVARADTPSKTLDVKSGSKATASNQPSRAQKMGISPFWIGVKRGDSAYLARDFDQALIRYREALQLDPQNALGHYRLGETELAKNQLSEAQASFEAALRFVRDDQALRSKILFVLADLTERTRSLDDARGKWNAYAEHAATNPNVKAFPQTAVERSRRIDTSLALEKDYAAVKERIRKREATTEARPQEKNP